MPIEGDKKQNVLTPPPTPFNLPLAVAGTAQDVVLVPVGKKGRSLSLINDGPGDIALGFDAAATISGTLIQEGERYWEVDLQLATKVSFINVTALATPTVRGVLWSGPA